MTDTYLKSLKRMYSCPKCGKAAHRINLRQKVNPKWRCTNPDCTVITLTEKEVIPWKAQ